MSSRQAPKLPSGDDWFTCITCLTARAKTNRNDFGDTRDLECMFCYRGAAFRDVRLQRRWCFKVKHSCERHQFFDLDSSGNITGPERGTCDRCLEDERRDRRKGPWQAPDAFEQWKEGVRKYTEWKEAAARKFAAEYGDLNEEEFKAMFPDEPRKRTPKKRVTKKPKGPKPAAATPKQEPLSNLSEKNQERLRSRAQSPKEYIPNKGSITLEELAALSIVSPVNTPIRQPSRAVRKSVVQPWRPGVVPPVIHISSDESSSSDEDEYEDNAPAQESMSQGPKEEEDDLPAYDTLAQKTVTGLLGEELTFNYPPSEATVEDEATKDFNEGVSAILKYAESSGSDESVAEPVKSTYGFDCEVCNMTRGNLKVSVYDGTCMYCDELEVVKSLQMVWCGECETEKVFQAFDRYQTGDKCLDCAFKVKAQNVDFGKSFLVKRDNQVKDGMQEVAEEVVPQKISPKSKKRTVSKRQSFDKAVVEAAHKKRNVQGVRSMPQ